MENMKELSQEFIDVAYSCGECTLSENPKWPLYSKCTYPTEHAPQLHVSVHDETSLKTLVAAANRFDVVIHPTSRGRNWGYGSRQPRQSPAVTVELNQLSAITHFNSEVGLVSIQPGVTFQQLDQFLNERGDEFFVSVPGSAPDSSVIGNTLQRGVGLGPTSERAKHMAGMRVLLSDGNILELGCRDAEVGTVFSISEPGPDLHGLFLQSGYGIVLELTLELVRHKKYERLYRVEGDDMFPLLAFHQKLVCLVDISTNTIISHRHRLSKHTKVDDSKVVPEWTMRFASYHPTALLDDGYQQICKDLATSHKLNLQSELIDRSLLRNEKIIDEARLNSRFVGIPNDVGHYSLYSSAMSYEEFREAKPDPNVDGKGFVWLDPIILNTPDTICSFVHSISKIYSDYNFIPDIGLNILDRHRCCCTLAIKWNREDRMEESTALALIEMIHSFLDRRCIRLSRETHLAPKSGMRFRREVVQGLKSILDPGGVLDM